jgi:hypothetical protein
MTYSESDLDWEIMLAREELRRQLVIDEYR